MGFLADLRIEASNRPDENQIRGMRYAFVGQTVGILLTMMLTRTAFGPLFLKALGASDNAAMWVFAVPGLLFMVQIPLSLAISPTKVKSFLIGGWTLFGLTTALAAAVPFWVETPRLRLQLVLAALFLSQVSGAVASTFWFPLLHEIVPPTVRGRFFGRLRASWSALLFAATAGAALYLGRTPSVLHFQRVIFIGVVLVFVRNALMAKIRVSPAGEAERGTLKSHLGYLLKTKEVRRFLIYFTLLGTAAGFLGQPLVLYLKELGFHTRDNMLIFGFSTLGTVIALLIGGNAVDKWGTRTVFRVVHLAVFVVLLFAGAARWMPSGFSAASFSIAFIAAGAAVSLAGLACTAHLFCFVPAKGRVFYLTVANFMLTVGPSAAMFITGEVLRQLGTVRSFHIGGGSIGIFPVMLFAAAVLTAVSTPLLSRIGLCEGAAAKKGLR